MAFRRTLNNLTHRWSFSSAQVKQQVVTPQILDLRPVPPVPQAVTKSIVVQKFGGTSLGTAERLRNVMDIIVNTTEEFKPVVVVSAMTSQKKSQGTTSRLLESIKLAKSGEGFAKELDAIYSHHVDVIEDLMTCCTTRDETMEWMRKEIESIKNILGAVSIMGDITQKAYDNIVASGERLSAYILSNALKNEAKIPAKYIDLTRAFSPDPLNPALPEFNGLVAEKCGNLIGGKELAVSNNNFHVPICTGFIGHIKGGTVQTFGRGYSDMTASIIAGHIDAQELQVWKEIAGIFSGDPTKVEGALELPRISISQAQHLTSFGREVLHPKTLEYVSERQIPVSIRGTFTPDSRGSIVDHDDSSSSDEPEAGECATQLIVGITSKANQLIMRISPNYGKNFNEWMQFIQSLFHSHGFHSSLTVTSGMNISFVIDESSPKAEIDAFVEKVREKGGEIDIQPERAIITAVGDPSMHVTSGIINTFVSALSEENINIELVSQGATTCTFSCLIDQTYQNKAVQVVHDAFFGTD